MEERERPKREREGEPKALPATRMEEGERERETRETPETVDLAHLTAPLEREREAIKDLGVSERERPSKTLQVVGPKEGER